MFPAAGGLSRNLGNMTRVRDDRVARSLDIHGPQGRAIGGPAPDPAWDALFGALQSRAEDAGQLGLNFRANFHNVGTANPEDSQRAQFARVYDRTHAPVAGLKQAARGTR